MKRFKNDRKSRTGSSNSANEDFETHTTINNYNKKESSESIDLDNKPKYVDYDNRPIKPLDQNVLNEKLSEYTEMSKEELESLRKKYVFYCLTCKS
jgi:hypothetical protein